MARRLLDVGFQASGGPLFTLSVWSIDLFRWLAGSEISEAHGTHQYTRLPQFGGTFGYDASVAVKFANGLAGCLQYSGTVGGRVHLVAGGDRQLNSRDSRHQQRDADRIWRGAGVTEWNLKERGARQWGHFQQDEYFVRVCSKARPPRSPPRTAVEPWRSP